MIRGLNELLIDSRLRQLTYVDSDEYQHGFLTQCRWTLTLMNAHSRDWPNLRGIEGRHPVVLTLSILDTLLKL